MSDATVTGWRTRLIRAGAWLLARPALLWVAAGLLTGLILPRIVAWIL